MDNKNVMLKKQHRFKDFLYWNMVISVPVITACLAGYRESGWFFLLYLIILIAGCGVIYRFFCTHCPHYIQSNRVAKCMFFWGIPKFFSPNPGPLRFIDKIITALTSVIIVALPLIWLLMQPDLLIIYILSLMVLAITIRRYECTRCIYVHCPSNKTPR